MKPDQLRDHSNLLKGILVVSLSLFVVSLFFPAFLIEENTDNKSGSYGLFLFLFGWMSFLAGGFIYFVVWLANPLYFLAIIFFAKNRKRSLYLNAMAVSLAIAFTQVDTMMVSESPSYSKITSLDLGFKLWLTSLIILLIGNMYSYIIYRKLSRYN